MSVSARLALALAGALALAAAAPEPSPEPEPAPAPGPAPDPAADPAPPAAPATTTTQGRCASAQTGSVTGDEYTTVERRVRPDTFTLEISEPDMCPEWEPVGLKVTACDADEAPHVYLLDATRGVVVREGALRTEAYVFITMFCSDSNQATYDYLDPTNLPSRLSKQELQSLLLPTSWTETTSGVATPPPQTLSILLSDQSLTSSGEATSKTSGVPDNPLFDKESEIPSSPLKLQSRFSLLSRDASQDHLMGRPGQRGVPNLSTREEIAALWKQRKISVLQKLKRYIDSIKLYGNETLTAALIDKILASLLKDSKPSWSQQPLPYTQTPKRLPELRPENTSPRLLTRSPTWLKRPAKPGTAWLRQAPRLNWSTRKSYSRPRKRIGGSSTDKQWRSAHEDESFLLHSGEGLDSLPHRKENNFVKKSRPSPLHIQHITKKRHRYVPPLYEEERTISADWPEQLAKRSPLPKLLLLLEEEEEEEPELVTKTKCESKHSVEDNELQRPNQDKQYSEDGSLWQQDYPADYTADDGNSFSHAESRGPQSHKTYHKEQSGSAPAQWLERPHKEQPGSKPAQWHDRSHKELSGSASSQWHDYSHNEPSGSAPSQWHDHPSSPDPPPFVPDSSEELCSKCPPENTSEESEHFQPGHPRSSPHVYRRPEHSQYEPVRFGAGAQNAHTERPVISSTPHHVPYTKGSKPSTQMQENLLSMEQGGHHMSAAHWNYLSKLLLSHPAFRDSTHIIKI